jgi:hypothetical protein
MTSIEKAFAEELELFRKEAQGATQHFYSDLAVNAAAGSRAAVLDLLNRAPLFWNTTRAALQIAAVLAIGRIFDKSSKHNVFRVLRLAQDNRAMFSKAALAARRSAESPNAPWLNGFIAKAYEPKAQDFRKLRARVQAWSRIYEQKYRDIRHSVYAHRLVTTQAEVDMLFAKTNIREVQRMLVFLVQLYNALWELFVNGNRPVLRAARYSVLRMRRAPRPEWQSRGVQEIIVGEVDVFFNAATGRAQRQRIRR